MINEIDRVCLFLVIVLFAGCAPMKGYEGPDLPDTETCHVITDSSDDIKIIESTVNKITDPKIINIRTLPGNIDFKVLATMTENCKCKRGLSNFDYTGWASCLKHSSTCDIRNYQSHQEICDCIHSENVCQGNFKCEKGLYYKVYLSKFNIEKQTQLRASVKTGGPVNHANFTCDKISQKNYVTTETYKGM